MADFQRVFSFKKKPKKIVAWIFILCLGFVFAAGGWNDFNNGSSGVGKVNNSVSHDGNITLIKNNSIFISDASGDWTLNFYIAFGLIVFAVIILCFFIWFWIRGSKNKWE